MNLHSRHDDIEADPFTLEVQVITASTEMAGRPCSTDDGCAPTCASSCASKG